MSNRYNDTDAPKCAQPLRSREHVEGARGPGLWRVIRSLLAVNCRGVLLFSRIDGQFIINSFNIYQYDNIRMTELCNVIL